MLEETDASSECSHDPAFADMHAWCQFVNEHHDATAICVDTSLRLDFFLGQKTYKLRVIIDCR